MDDDRVVALDVEHADLEQRSVGRRADEHDQVIIQMHPSRGVANGVPYVCVVDAVLSRWLSDPYLIGACGVDRVRFAQRDQAARALAQLAGVCRS